MYIYIHIPFCAHICSYCDFPKMLYTKKYIDKYLDCLKDEIKSRYNGELIKSIYIGGGTPTCLSSLELEKLFNILSVFNKSDDCEFTIESNIESIDKEKVILFNKYGINRVSLGVQSFDNNILGILNRYHKKEDVFSVISLLKEYIINNISIDLIYGVNDDIDVVKRDIDTFLRLDIPHISCYSLIVEDNTLFGINKRDYIDDSIESNMYNYICNKLSDNGYFHYEVSNYSKEGYQSKHNINYWMNGEYLGFGVGSVSMVNNYRISNTKSLTKYLNGEYIFYRELEDRDVSISNTIILGLRMVKGINIKNFNDRFNCNLLDLYNIRDLISDNILIISCGNLFINSKYFYLSNEILINFM